MNGGAASLPLDVAARFQVYEARKITLAAGDWIRIMQNGFTKEKQRLNNGDLKQVKGFTKDGDIRVANGWVVSKNYGNLTHGYFLTSYSSQSKGVDCVFVAESSESFRAAVRKSSHRPAALDLMMKKIVEPVVGVPVKKSLTLRTTETARRQISQIRKHMRLQRICQFQFRRGMGI